MGGRPGGGGGTRALPFINGHENLQSEGAAGACESDALCSQSHSPASVRVRERVWRT